MLPYAPFYIGLIVSLLELFLVPRKEVKVRFHASQAIALHIAILIVHTLFGVISTITDSSLGGTLFKLAAFVFLIISMIRVGKGEPHRIAPLAEPAQWFNEHIEPRNQGLAPYWHFHCITNRQESVGRLVGRLHGVKPVLQCCTCVSFWCRQA